MSGRPPLERMTGERMQCIGRPRHVDPEARSRSEPRRQRHVVAEQVRQPANDRQAEAHAAGCPGRVAPALHLIELLEYPVAMFRRNADARIDDLDRNVCAAPPCADHDAAARRVAHRVSDEIANHPFEEGRVAVDGEPRGCAAQDEPLRRRLRLEFRDDAREERRQRDARAFGRKRAGLEPRQIEQLRELRLERIDGVLDVADQRPPGNVTRARRKGRRVQPERVQRLPQVVACRREQLALGAIGRLGRSARFVRGACLARKPRDEVGVFIADGERARQNVVQVVPEGEHESQDDGHHQRRERMHRIGDQRFAQDQRNQCGNDKAIERWLVDGGEIEAA